MWVLLITQLLQLVGGWNLVNWFNNNCWLAIVTGTDRPKSVRNRCEIVVFDGVFHTCCHSFCVLEFSFFVGAFVIGLIQISSFSSLLLVRIVYVHNEGSFNLRLQRIFLRNPNDYRRMGHATIYPLLRLRFYIMRKSDRPYHMLNIHYLYNRQWLRTMLP